MREGDKMQITISNYNNIRNLDYEIEDSKINFLFVVKVVLQRHLLKKVQKIIYRITQKIFLLLR